MTETKTKIVFALSYYSVFGLPELYCKYTILFEVILGCCGK